MGREASPSTCAQRRAARGRASSVGSDDFIEASDDFIEAVVESFCTMRFLEKLDLVRCFDDRVGLYVVRRMGAAQGPMIEMCVSGFSDNEENRDEWVAAARPFMRFEFMNHPGDHVFSDLNDFFEETTVVGGGQLAAYLNSLRLIEQHTPVYTM